MYPGTIGMAKNKSINLLPQEEFETSTLGRILRWAMGTFRIIVIITEMVVMGAFLSRFWLDARNSDLSDSIKIASSQIQVQSDFEKKFRLIQTKLDVFKQISLNVKASDRVQSISSKTPAQIVISSIVTNETSTEIKGDAGSEADIAQFISNLKSNSGIKKIDLNSINSSENNEALMSFQITVNY
jgi:Tfp pilus assembly protein PilN